MNRPAASESKTSACETDCPVVASLRRQVRFARHELEEARQGFAQSVALRQRQTAKDVHACDEARIAELQARLTAEREEHAYALAKVKSEARARESALKETIVDLKSKLSLYADAGPPGNRSENVAGEDLESRPKGEGKRGVRKDPKGGGRNVPKNLPTTVNTITPPPEECVCGTCGKPFEPFGCETADQVEFRVVLRRVVERRESMKPVCGCPGNAIVTASPAPRAFPKRLLSDDSVLEICLLKYEHHLPFNAMLKIFAEEGWPDASASTLRSAQGALCEYLEALEKAFTLRNLDAGFWQADESGMPVFQRREGYQGNYWTIWQIRTDDTVIHKLTPTRKADEIKEYFEGAPRGGTLVVDRAKVYSALAFLLAYCWAHVRRDFIKLGRHRPGNASFAREWLGKIRRLYRLFRRSRGEPDDETLRRQLSDHLESMKARFEEQLADERLPDARRKPLESLRNHWEGLTRFLDDPRIPLDNNAVERAFRALAAFRKNSFGCHSKRAAMEVARFFTVIDTLKLNGLVVKDYLRAYLRAAVRDGDKAPENLDDWMPWQLSESVKAEIRAAGAAN